MKHKCDGCKYKSVHQEMMFRPFGVCSKKTDLIEAAKAYNAEKCPYKKTNADRIRAMSDEELRTLLCTHSDCALCKWDEPQGCTLTKWLEQTAEVE